MPTTHSARGPSWRRIARTVVCTAALAAAAIAPAAPTPAPVTDATVVARLGSITRKQDHEALAAYYRGKAAAALPAIEAQERLFRAYMTLDPKQYSGLQKEARALLKAARMMKKHYDLLAVVHQRKAWEWTD